MAALWRAHGLRGVDDAALTIAMPFSSFDDYWQPFLCGQGLAGAYVASLPESRREALRNRLRERLLGGGPDDGFTRSARAWAVRGAIPNA